MTNIAKKPKGHGRGARIEGAMSEGQRVLLVGGSDDRWRQQVVVCRAVRENRGDLPAHTAVIFYYDIYPMRTVQTLGRSRVNLARTCARGMNVLKMSLKTARYMRPGTTGRVKAFPRRSARMASGKRES